MWPVGTKLPNAIGLFDTHGNAWEWCHSLHSTQSGQSGTVIKHNSPRVLRGGSFDSPPLYVCVDYNNYNSPANSNYLYGFRPVRTINLASRIATKARMKLLRPLQNEMLDNSSLDRSSSYVWNFEWQKMPGASDYHLFVKGANATIPLVNKDGIQSTRYQHTRSGSYVIKAYLHGWRWKVRAKVKGVWGPWSKERTFDVSPPKPRLP